MPLDIEALREYCIKKKGVTEEFPFGNETLVYKVMGKVFLLGGIDNRPFTFNAKCDPALALELREKYEDVQPGYHMNKKHWNTVVAEGRIPKKELLEMVDHSYSLVVNGLPKIMKDKLNKLK